MGDRFSNEQIVHLTRRAIHRIDTQGVRGATLLSTDEIIAMAAFITGLTPMLEKAITEAREAKADG